MRYRARTNRVEYLAAILPSMDGIKRLTVHHGYFHSGPLRWHLLADIVFAYLVTATPLLLVLRYFYSYFELTPSTLEYRNLWMHHSVPYGQIDHIVTAAGFGVAASANIVEVHPLGLKKLRMSLEEPAEFITALKQYAPQARLEDPVT